VLAAVLSSLTLPQCAGSADSSTLSRGLVRRGSDALRELSELGLRQACQRQIEQTEHRAEARHGPLLDPARRAQLLARAEGEPVVFVRRPRRATTLSRRARRLIAFVESASSPGNALLEIYKQLLKQRSLAREVLLREGYLYTESPALAAALVRAVRLEHLFSEPELVIERGSRRMKAIRVGKHYEDPEADFRNRRTTLVLFDRVWVAGQDPGPPLHRSVRPLQNRLGFERLHVRTVTPDAIVADLGYGEAETRAVLSSHGSEAVLSCELVPRGQKGAIAKMRRTAHRRHRVLEALRRTVLAQISEALPFDEPRTEEGQQDGKLRGAWRKAYEYGRGTYEFNDDRYFVFDGAGRPRVPQVCIDFIIDTLERLSGTWWQPRNQPRERTKGRFDFRDFEVDNHRSVESFLEFAGQHPEWFTLSRVPDSERIPLVWRKRFFDKIYAQRHNLRPGDIVAIYGLRDDDKMHYHSFFILEDDPVTGMPIRVASNAGRPRIRSWESEMINAPKRGIRAWVRPKLAWYEAIVEDEARRLSRVEENQESPAI
jgi:hypothetical protein